MADGMQRVFRALSSPTRREILDVLRTASQTTGDLCARFPSLSRFAVMKHLSVLEGARLVIASRDGRTRLNTLNVVPIQRLYERWIRPYEVHWAAALLALKENAERESHGATGTSVPKTVIPKAAPLPPILRAAAADARRSRARSPGTAPRSPATSPSSVRHSIQKKEKQP